MPHKDEWQYELERVVTRRSELEEVLRLTDDERRAIDAIRSAYPLKVSRHYLSLINPVDPDDPLRRVVIPSLAELEQRPGESDDDVHADEATYQPCPGIIHRYQGKLLLIPTLGCPTHCRFCFRKGRKVRHLNQEESDVALAYIRKDHSIRDVIITGGEPFLLDDDELYYWLSSVRAIPHVQIIRITSRFPIYIPSRITDSLIEILAEHKPLFLTFSFVHPREITPEIERGLARLSDAGIVLLQQGPMLRGVNDSTAVLMELYERLASLRVLPYYAIWGIHAPGAEHFMIDGRAAAELVGALENKTSGFCVPHLITIARGDKVRMMGWSPQKEALHLGHGRARGTGAPTYPAARPESRHS
jgi:lysine 2,3-aminomutase